MNKIPTVPQSEIERMAIERYHKALKELVRAIDLSNTVKARCKFCKMTSTMHTDQTPEVYHALVRAKQVLMGVR